MKCNNARFKNNAGKQLNFGSILIIVALAVFLLAPVAVTAQIPYVPVWAWGNGYWGGLGNQACHQSGSSSDYAVPVSTSTGLPFDIAYVTSGTGHQLVIDSDGNAWAWGANSWGQCGNGDGNYDDVCYPDQIDTSNMGQYDEFTVVNGGGEHSLGIDNNGHAWVWGNNENGQLGNGSSGSGEKENAPVAVDDTDLNNGTTVTSVSAGYYHSLFLRSDGTVWACGANGYGQLGDGTTTQRVYPVQVKVDASNYLTNITAIAAGYYHSLALKSDGTVWAWGQNNAGQLGDGTTTERHYAVQVDDTNLTNATSIDAGFEYSIALDNNGDVWAWGYNNYGQLGDDNCTTDSDVPVQVDDTNVQDIDKIVAGKSSCVALRNDGTVWTWGYNQSGELADGTFTNRCAPVQAKWHVYDASLSPTDYYGDLRGVSDISSNMALMTRFVYHIESKTVSTNPTIFKVRLYGSFGSSSDPDSDVYVADDVDPHNNTTFKDKDTDGYYDKLVLQGGSKFKHQFPKCECVQIKIIDYLSNEYIYGYQRCNGEQIMCDP